jgi:DNA-directed RNA polymerase specialized sigma subunit
MSKTYWVKKNPNCEKSKIEWIQINGIEFYKFITSPKGKDRYFIDLENFMIESTKAEYVKWRSEKDHSDYLKEQEEGYKIVSFYSMDIEHDCNGEDVIEDSFVNVESAIERLLILEKLSEALLILSTEECLLIDKLYLCNPPKTERELSALIGIPQKTINDRKNRILNGLNNFLKNNPLKTKKSSQ